MRTLSGMTAESGEQGLTSRPRHSMAVVADTFWHAKTACDALPSTVTVCGTWLLQTGITCGQRVWNRQPGGGRNGEAGSPCGRSRASPATRRAASSRGTAASRLFV